MSFAMNKFYKKLLNEKNPNVIFKEYDGKIFSSVDLSELNIPKGYQIIDGKIFKADKFVGNIEKMDEDMEKNLDNENIDIDEDLFDDDLDDGLNDLDDSDVVYISSPFKKIGYGIKRLFSRKSEDIDLDSDNDLSSAQSDSSQVKKESKVKNLFASIGGFFIGAKNFIGQKISNFFEYLGKRKDVEISADLLDNNTIKKDDDTKVNDSDDKKGINNDDKTKDEKEKFVKALDTINNNIMVIEKIKRSKGELDYTKFDTRFVNLVNKYKDYFNKFADDISFSYENLLELVKESDSLKKDIEEYVSENNKTNNKTTMQSSTTTPVSNTTTSTSTNTDDDKKEIIEELLRKFKVERDKADSIIDEYEAKFDNDKADDYIDDFNNILYKFYGVSEEEFDNMNAEQLDDKFNGLDDEQKIKRLRNAIRHYIRLSREINEELKNSNEKSNKFEFKSIEDTKTKFKEYDSRESVEEKIKYYEEFLRTHDLSHPDDQAMKERMEQKLADLKSEYADGGKTADNQNRTEQMAYYTQTAKGIDKEIDRIEKERQLKILQAELAGETIINLGLNEERTIDAKKADLLRLKKECLERKAKVNKYYEEQAERMTAALKR